MLISEVIILNYKQKCRQIRLDILKEFASIGVGHVGGSFSIVELLVVLYYKHMKFDAKNPGLESRDRLIVSKGHSGPAVYAVLADVGFFDKDWLLTLNQNGTNLPSHCDMHKTPGIDMTTGSLGQGFSCAIGIAKALKMLKNNAKVYTIIGDGEAQEGQIWESTMFAAHQKLDNIIAFVDNNRLQIDGLVSNVCEIEPLDKKFEAFGWNVITVQNGHDCDEIDSAISNSKSANKPTMIILKTTKGYGVSFIQNALSNHNMPINYEMFEKAMVELNETQYIL